MFDKTIYDRLFDGLIKLIPGLKSIKSESYFCALPAIKGNMAVFCHVAEAEGGLYLIELAGNCNSISAISSPRIRLRVDMSNRQAEVMEMEDEFGYQSVYAATHVVNSRRKQINLFAMNWLQVFVQSNLVCRPADKLMAA